MAKMSQKSKNNKYQGFSYFFFLDDKSTQIRNPDPNPDPDLYLWQTDLDPGGLKTAVWELR
jgi:hypothetical protein